MNGKRKKKAKNERQDWSLNLNVVHPNAAGIDIGNESHYVAVPPDRDAEPVRQFACFTEDVRRLAAWLKSCGIDYRGDAVYRSVLAPGLRDLDRGTAGVSGERTAYQAAGQ
jgi:hypothetical protein